MKEATASGNQLKKLIEDKKSEANLETQKMKDKEAKS